VSNFRLDAIFESRKIGVQVQESDYRSIITTQKSGQAEEQKNTRELLNVFAAD